MDPTVTKKEIVALYNYINVENKSTISKEAFLTCVERGFRGPSVN
jgi:hypothetical protein